MASDVDLAAEVKKRPNEIWFNSFVFKMDCWIITCISISKIMNKDISSI